MQLSSPSAPYMLFLVVVAVMITAGAGLQLFLPLALGLMASEVIGILGPAMVARKGLGDDRFPGLGRPQVGAWALAAVAGTSALLGVLANLLAGLVVLIVPSLQARLAIYEETTRQLLEPGSWPLAIAGVISITVFAPFCEEMLFRGTILPLQRRHEPLRRAIVVNGLLFGALHFNVITLLPLSLVGAYFASVASRTRTIWPVVLGHASLNGFNGVVLPFILRAMEVEPGGAPSWSGIVPGLVVVGGAVAVAWRASLRTLRPMA